MKAHPRAALLHVGLKRRALCGVFGTGIPKNHHLIAREKGGIEILPVGSGVEGKMVLRRHLRKPPLGFVHEADMCRILSGGKKCNHAEPRLAVLGAQARTAGDERRNAQGSQGSHLSPPSAESWITPSSEMCSMILSVLMCVSPPASGSVSGTTLATAASHGRRLSPPDLHTCRSSSQPWSGRRRGR